MRIHAKRYESFTPEALYLFACVEELFAERQVLKNRTFYPSRARQLKNNLPGKNIQCRARKPL